MQTEASGAHHGDQLTNTCKCQIAVNTDPTLRLKLTMLHISCISALKPAKTVNRGFPGSSVLKGPPAAAGGTGEAAPSLGREDPPEEEGGPLPSS